MNTNDKDLRQVIAEKSGLLNGIVQRKFGSNPDAAATGGEENLTGGGSNMTMRVTRSAGSNAPGEVVDGKLVDLKAMAASATRNDVPQTDLLALARANDPHNDSEMPVTLAGGVIASDKGLPGQSVAEDHSKDLGNLDEERKKSLHQKQHGPIEKAVTTDVGSQLSDKDPYKTLHAGVEVDEIVARAKAVLSGADAIRAAASEVANPGAGKTEDGGQGKVEGDAGKNAVDSAKTLGDGGKPKAASLSNTTERKDVLAAIRAESAQRQAKVDGALIDPAKGADAGKTPEESAKTMGDGGSEKSASTKVAESKDRPLASMPEGKKRYPADDDNRDDEAKSYWKKNKADESRFDKEPAADRPITRETQDKMPKLSPQAAQRQNLLTRLAGLATVLAASEDEAARLHLKRRNYNKDEAQDMDFGGAAGRTKSEINKEHGQRSSESGSLSPMMSRLWSAYGPVKVAADESGYHGEIDKDGDKKKQVAEMQKAVKGLKAEDKGADAAMSGMEKKIEAMECDMAKASGVGLGQKSISALATAQDRLAVIAAVLGDIGRLCKISHMEAKFALEKPHGTGVSNDMVSLLEDLGETVDDMEGVIDMALKDMGHPGLKDKDPWKGGKPGDDGASPMGEPKGQPAMEKKEELPPMGGAMPELGAKTVAPVKTAFEIEDEQVEKVASDSGLSDEQRRTRITELRAGSTWTAVFSKVADKNDANKPDMSSSYWEVMRGAEPVLKVSVSDAYPVKTAAGQAEAFAWFATKDYGRKLLASAKFEGLGKTAKLLGLSQMVKSAAAALDKKLESEKAYFSKAFGSSEYAAELLKDHEKKAAANEAGLKAKIAELESKAKTETDRNDRLQSDIAMRAKAAKALDLAQKAMAKGMVSIEHKAQFIDSLMLGDDQAFKITTSMVDNFKPVAAQPQAEEHRAVITVKDLLKVAAAGNGLKTPIVMEAAPVGGLTDQLGQMWRKPPTAQ